MGQTKKAGQVLVGFALETENEFENAEKKLKKLSELQKINKKQKKLAQTIIDRAWTEIWHFHPDNNPSLEQSFKLNFS